MDSGYVVGPLARLSLRRFTPDPGSRRARQLHACPCAASRPACVTPGQRLCPRHGSISPRTSRVPVTVGPSVRIPSPLAFLSLVFALVSLAMASVAPAAAQSGSGNRVQAESGTLAGQILAGGMAAPSVEVEVRPASGSPAIVRVTGPDGEFVVDSLTPGRYAVRAQTMGYAPAATSVTVSAGETARVELRLEPAAIALDPLVVTGTLSEVRVSDSPVKVDVVSGDVLQRFATTNLMDAVGRVNGLYQQVDCGVCYTNNIRINGMEGPYTAVLIDGMPIMGALASVYGLNGIHPSTVERLEILKGPQSTLYGTEAMGGVVNIITKDARFTPGLTLEASRSDLGENNVSMAWSPGSGRSGTLLGASLLQNDRFVDENGDTFSDLTLDTRVNLFGKTDFRRNGRRIGGLTAKVYWEDRFGGPDDWTEADRGSSTLYGESIQTRRAEVMGRIEGPWAQTRFEGSYAFHDQDSWYGDTEYRATQQIGFAQFLWDPARGDGRHDLLVGANLRYVRYDDQTPATATAEQRYIPGIFAENQVSVTRRLTVLGGLRVDHHRAHGLIPSPRMSLMFEPDEATTLRLNAGTGFRVVNLFTEDHAALTGAREVVIQGDLRPERSASVAFNANRVLGFDANPMMLDLDLFYTRFSNRIIPDYDTDPNQIIYRNLDGRRSVSRGLAVAVNQNFGQDLPLFYTVGVTFQDVFIEGAGDTTDELFAPDFRGVWNVSYIFGQAGRGLGALVADYGGALTGRMRLPEFEAPFTRPSRSPVFATHDVQLTWRRDAGQEVYLGIRNLGDYTQGSPLVDPANPFGDAFDTSYFWGPVVGRRLTLGVRWMTSR